VLLIGASRGLGAALAVAFAAEGCNLCLVARNAPQLTAVQADCAAAGRAHGIKVITVVADVCSAEECQKVVDQCTTVLGKVDVLCNNGAPCSAQVACIHTQALTWRRFLRAAAIVTWQPFWEVSAHELQETLRCNIEAPLLLTRLVLPAMLRRNAGAIVNISSRHGPRCCAAPRSDASRHGVLSCMMTRRCAFVRVRSAAFIALPGHAVYCASKAALNNFGLCLRAELQVGSLHTFAMRACVHQSCRTAAHDASLDTQGTDVRVVTICPAGIPEAGMYADRAAQQKHKDHRCVVRVLVCLLVACVLRPRAAAEHAHAGWSPSLRWRRARWRGCTSRRWTVSFAPP
jgi:short-subunit dehydrogenase